MDAAALINSTTTGVYRLPALYYWFVAPVVSAALPAVSSEILLPGSSPVSPLVPLPVSIEVASGADSFWLPPQEVSEKQVTSKATAAIDIDPFFIEFEFFD